MGKTTGPVTRTPRTDSGWAWAVNCGGFVAFFTAMGYSSSLSVYLTIWMDYFDASAVTAGLIISMMVLTRGIMGPISGALCSKYGPRVVTMLGGVIFVTGAVMSSQAPTIEFLIFSNGFVTAIGQSMVYIAAVHALGMYFKKRIAFAVGLASAGVSVGQLVFPPMVTYLIDIYGWEGSVLVTAAINLHLLAAGALMRPVGKKTSKNKRHDFMGQVSVPAQLNGSVPRVERETQNDYAIGDSCNAERNRDLAVLDEDEIEEIEVNDVAMILAKNCPGTIEKSTQHFVVLASEDGVNPSAFTDPPESSAKSFTSYFSRLKHFLLHTYGLRRLVRNTSFILTIVVSFLHGFGRLGIIYIVPRAKSVGIDLDSSALLLSVFGIGSCVGRIGHGWFIDKRYITGEMAYALSLLVFCVTVTLMPAFVVFISLAILALLLGSVAGISSAVVMVIIRTQVHQSDASEALGIMLLFTSVGNVFGVLVSGVAYDNTETYDIAFFVAGGILLIASLLCVVIYFLKKAKLSRGRVYLPTAFYVKLPRKTTVDIPRQAADSVTGEPGSNVDGLGSDDRGITNPGFVLGLSDVSTSAEDVARTINVGLDQPVEQMKDINLIRDRLGGDIEEHDIGGLNSDDAGITNPLFTLGLSDVSTSDEDVARTTNVELEQPVKPKKANNLIRDRLGREIEEHEIGGIVNPLAVDQIDELCGFTVTEEPDKSNEVDEINR